MADEISATLALVAAKGGASIEAESMTITMDMTGADMASWTQSVGTSNEALDVPADLAAPCHMLIKNLDATNYVEIFSDNANAELASKLRPGEACFICNWDVTGYARANTAATLIQVWACEQ